MIKKFLLSLIFSITFFSTIHASESFPDFFEKMPKNILWEISKNLSLHELSCLFRTSKRIYERDLLTYVCEHDCEIFLKNIEKLEKKPQICLQKSTYEVIRAFLCEPQYLDSIYRVNEIFALKQKGKLEKYKEIQLKFGQIMDILIGQKDKKQILNEILTNEYLYYIHDRLGGSYRATKIFQDKLVEEKSSLIQSPSYILFLDYCRTVDNDLLDITFSRKTTWAIVDLKSPTLGFCAAYFGNLEAVKYLANHDQQKKKWYRSLHQKIPTIYLAALKKHASVVLYLLKLEPSYTTQAFLGKTKLGQVTTLLSASCFEEGNEEIIDFFIDARLKKVKSFAQEKDWLSYLLSEKGREEREYLEHALTISFIKNNPQNFRFILKKLTDTSAPEELVKFLVKNVLINTLKDEGHPVNHPCYNQHFYRTIRDFMVDQEGKIKHSFEKLQTNMLENIKKEQIPFGFNNAWGTVLGSSIWTSENKIILYYIVPELNKLLLKGATDTKWIDILIQNKGMNAFKFLFEIAEKETTIHEFLRLFVE